jgi:hypothetical protein
MFELQAEVADWRLIRPEGDCGIEAQRSTATIAATVAMIGVGANRKRAA